MVKSLSGDERSDHIILSFTQNIYCVGQKK